MLEILPLRNIFRPRKNWWLFYIPKENTERCTPWKYECIESMRLYPNLCQILHPNRTNCMERFASDDMQRHRMLHTFRHFSAFNAYSLVDALLSRRESKRESDAHTYPATERDGVNSVFSKRGIERSTESNECLYARNVQSNHRNEIESSILLQSFTEFGGAIKHT